MEFVTCKTSKLSYLEALNVCREPVLEMDSLATKKLDNRPQNSVFRNPREGATPCTPELRRSRSTPRGKLLGLS